MAKTHKRRNLEKRLAGMGFELLATRQVAGWIIKPRGIPVALYGITLYSVEKIADWLEAQGLVAPPGLLGESLDAESQNTGFLRGIAQSSINALETAGEINELIELLGWLKKTIKLLDPDYDVTTDPT